MTSPIVCDGGRAEGPSRVHGRAGVVHCEEMAKSHSQTDRKWSGGFAVGFVGITYLENKFSMSTYTYSGVRPLIK